ncbi:hypothetical protein HYH02_008402 [Chlamydomonas schloesseri]|uniref:Uncharacterized protein n=1 Tax=Chlamydomonas schloesseri TaxID=2026947 RepID=A0A836B3K7_9CHLO|nr:hypothetical protein HYH02_008402 [Chlamydomonas schloesseri]|eukprot:KAG2446408.1 hypothetical protein HYH02_008402 [Chlamydomonas schloesseri]
MIQARRALRGLVVPESWPPAGHLAPGLIRTLVADTPEARDLHSADSRAPASQDVSVSGREREEPCTSPRCGGLAPAVRAQGASLGRRKVLPPAGTDAFVSNVATLLLTLQQQHAPAESQAGRAAAARSRSLTWREVVGDPRFLQLFPRRISPDIKEILQRLQGGAGNRTPDSGGSEAAQKIAWTREDAARHSAMLQLINQLQEVQRQLQEAMPQDEGSDSEEDSGGTDSSYVTVAAFTLDDDALLPPARPGDMRSASSSGREADGATCANSLGPGELLGQAASSWPCPMGRRRRSPGGRPLRAPAPPWDDTQPFQTHVGTVYHFWRLAPYG